MEVPDRGKIRWASASPNGRAPKGRSFGAGAREFVDSCRGRGKSAPRTSPSPTVGADPGELPASVHIVYDGRFALAKKARGDCAVELATVQELMEKSTAERVSGRLRRGGVSPTRWSVQVEGRSRDARGRPLLSIFRANGQHQRSLRAGIPVSTDSKAWTDEHRWQLEYLDVGKENGTLGAPFHLQCTAPPRLYLAVNETVVKAVMQKERPRKPWQLMDATGNSVSAHAAFSMLNRNLTLWNATPEQEVLEVIPRLESFCKPPPVAAALESKRIDDEAVHAQVVAAQAVPAQVAKPAKVSPPCGCLSACWRWLPSSSSSR